MAPATAARAPAGNLSSFSKEEWPWDGHLPILCKGDGMDTSPLSLKKNGHSMVTPSFLSQGDGDGHLSILSEGRGGWALETSPAFLKRNGHRMVTSPFYVKGRGLDTSPLYQKGDGDGRISILSNEKR